MFQEKLRLDGRVAVVFGAGGGGMGTQTSLALAEAGATLVAVDITDDRVNEIKQQAEQLGATCIGVVGDVRSAEDLDRVFAAAAGEGGVDCLVNLVGGVRLVTRESADVPGTAWLGVSEIPDWIYEDIVAVNMTYVFRSCRLAAAQMIESKRPGTIVNFASISAVAGAPYHAAYGMAKAGVMSLTRTLAVELGPHGIRANCVVPGSVPAPLAREASPAAYSNISDRASAKAPLGRRVAPEEIAGAVLFLLSPLSGGITGHCLPVDAGVSANSPLGTGPEYLATTQLRR